MAWDYYIVARRVCGGCGGTCGWNVKNGFHKCSTCQGTGVEEKEASLEEALAESKIIKELQEVVGELINEW